MKPGHNHSSTSTPSVVIFDLDGTITRPCLDFDVIRREIGLPTEPRTPVLEAMENMDAAQRARAEAILHRYEEEAAQASELQDGACEVVELLRLCLIPLGLLTRNSRYCAELVTVLHGLQFDHIYTREDGPAKPSPEPVYALCRQLGANPATSWLIGDYLFDIQAGNAAGATTVLMIGDKTPPDYADQADHVIRKLTELPRLMKLSEAGD